MDKFKLLAKIFGFLLLIGSVVVLVILVYRWQMSRFTSTQEIAKQLKSMESQFLKYENRQFFVTTYNVNRKSPNGIDRLDDDWLIVDSNSSDLYAIGLQEADLTSEESQSLSDSFREQEWLKEITTSLKRKGNYTNVASVRLKGTMLAVFVKNELLAYVSGISSTTVPTGILGKWGGKAVLIRFELHHTSLCFISSHLMPFLEETEMRNQEFHEIADRAKFRFENRLAYIQNHDLVYWMGDLNYRLDELGPDEVKERIERNETDSLLTYDQLKRGQKANKTFTEYNEAEITFRPTYKYDPGTDLWDTSAKNRAPAWCDRVLWTGPTPTVCLAYRSHPKLLLSDHKPVSALFDTQIKRIDTEAYKKAFEQVTKKLGIKNSDIQPEVTVDKKQIDFGKFSFRDQVKGTLKIVNTGLVDVFFELGIRSGTKPRSWLRVKPSQGALMIDQERTLELEIEVDQKAAPEFARRGTLNETLVVWYKEIDESLKTYSKQNNSGHEISIALNGDYMPSCFGSSIECLVRLKNPVSNSTEWTKLMNGNCGNASDEDLDTPKELRFIVEKLTKRGLTEKLLFEKPGLRKEFHTIRNAVDHYDLSKLSVSSQSLAESVLYFLDSLAEPVVPYAFYSKAIQSAGDLESSKQVIEEIPAAHRKVFYFVIAFIKDALNESDANRLTPEKMANMFGQAMLKPFKGTKTNDDKNRALFVRNFLFSDQQ